MFLGHYAAALAAKKAAPETSLGTLVVGAQLADLLWPGLVLAGVEHVRVAPEMPGRLAFEHYPFSHSLLALAGWALFLGGTYWVLRRSSRGAVTLGLLVLSHWVFDLLVHLPDLPVLPGAPWHVGLGLWRSLPATLLLEFGLLVVGALVYLRHTRARDGVGRYAVWSLLLALGLFYIASLVGPPPADPGAVASAALLGWLVIPWAAWADGHREVRVS